MFTSKDQKKVAEEISNSTNTIGKGTVLEGAQLDVIEIPGRGRCRNCGSERELRQFVERCTCGSANVERLAGEELTIKQMVTV